jgi:hypothetical protein
MALPGGVFIIIYCFLQTFASGIYCSRFRVKIFKAFGQLTVWDEHPLTTCTQRGRI